MQENTERRKILKAVRRLYPKKHLIKSNFIQYMTLLVTVLLRYEGQSAICSVQPQSLRKHK